MNQVLQTLTRHVLLPVSNVDELVACARVQAIQIKAAQRIIANLMEERREDGSAIAPQELRQYH